MAEQFYTILTQIGKAKMANASTLGQKVEFSNFALGDGNGSYYNPIESQTELKNEVWRGKIGNVAIDDDNPNWIVIETIIPASTGGFMIREAGVFDDEGNMLAVGKYPETYKPIVENGSAKDLYIRMILEVSNTAVVNLKIDPTIILATKKDIDILSNRIKKNENDISSHKAEIAKSIKIKKNVTILSANWTKLGELYQYNILDTDITEDTVVDVNIHLADLDKADGIKSSNLSSAGKVTLYADGEVTEDILCDLKLIRQVSE